jgi:threonine synthase
MRDIDFCELLHRGEITRLPRLFAVQPENCAPLHATFLTGGDEVVVIEAKPTIAEGTSIAKPVRTREVLAAVRRSRGKTVAVSESEIEAAHGELARTGLYVEPTSASAAAALSKLLDAGVVRHEETTVLVLTGSGLKATQRIGALMSIVP